MKIKGFNAKEQKCYDIIEDGEPHTIAEMTKKFMAQARKHCGEIFEEGSWDDNHASGVAQSFVRNSIRRLIRDGWIEKCAYGTYRLTRAGKKWVAEGKDETASFGTKRGRKAGSNLSKASTKKAETKKASPKKAETKKASTKKASTKKAETKKASTKKASKAKANGKAEAKKKAQAAKKRAGKAAAMERAEVARQSLEVTA
jgi:hypothetical protein